MFCNYNTFTWRCSMPLIEDDEDDPWDEDDTKEEDEE